jgi:hypothetical protein
MRRDWWTCNPDGTRNRYDYIIALAIHSLFWSFTILFPIAYRLGFEFSWFYSFAIIGNAIIHGIVDNHRINVKKINLVLQEAAHIWQILLTYLLFVLHQLCA